MEFAFGLLGIALGALIQFHFNRRSNHESRALEMESEAYADYINAVVGASLWPNTELLQNATAAKARIYCFGDEDILHHLEKFEKTSKQLDDPEAQPLFTALLRAIRRRCIASGSVTHDTLSSLLFGDSNERGNHDLRRYSA